KQITANQVGSEPELRVGRQRRAFKGQPVEELLIGIVGHDPWPEDCGEHRERNDHQAEERERAPDKPAPHAPGRGGHRGLGCFNCGHRASLASLNVLTRRSAAASSVSRSAIAMSLSFWKAAFALMLSRNISTAVASARSSRL